MLLLLVVGVAVLGHDVHGHIVHLLLCQCAPRCIAASSHWCSGTCSISSVWLYALLQLQIGIMVMCGNQFETHFWVCQCRLTGFACAHVACKTTVTVQTLCLQLQKPQLQEQCATGNNRATQMWHCISLQLRDALCNVVAVWLMQTAVA